ncbi:hypothetical protein PsYK624_142350 [Phanerochaete sordida]|uniref:DUF6533 domain-containing protein n=1 Tax=Phanerochaete sordida TaxID=48140 RepID=A0A9P3GLG9_9APHY|nr:hypothetical protein PsYK624_142350 [Phanerochaete sordida]
MHDHAATVQGKLYTSYGAVSAVMWMLYDTAIHFDVEVDCIWRRPTTWVKYAYAFVRYVPILNGGAVLALTANLTYPPAGCRGWIIDQLVVIECVTVAVELVLMLRVYAMYNRNKIVGALVGGGFAAEAALMGTTLALVVPRQTFTPDCLVASSPGIYMAYWLSSLCFETALFALTLYKFLRGVARARGRHSVLFLFVRDGTWAYAIIFAAMLFNTLMYQLVTTPLAGMGYFFALSIMSFAGSHILLNIRRLGMRMDSAPAALDELSSFAAAAVSDRWSSRRTDATEELSAVPPRAGAGVA